jgi:hypothetical protein
MEWKKTINFPEPGEPDQNMGSCFFVGWAKRSVPNINNVAFHLLGTLRFAQPTCCALNAAKP